MKIKEAQTTVFASFIPQVPLGVPLRLALPPRSRLHPPHVPYARQLLRLLLPCVLLLQNLKFPQPPHYALLQTSQILHALLVFPAPVAPLRFLQPEAPQLALLSFRSLPSRAQPLFLVPDLSPQVPRLRVLRFLALLPQLPLAH